MTIKSLLVTIGVDLAAFEAGMNKMKANMEAHQKTFTAIGGTMTAIGGVMTAFFGKAISEAVKSEAAQARLHQALSNVAGAAKGGADMLIEYAGALQQTTGIEDEAIESAMSLLATFGLNEKQIAALTPRVLDMAVAHSKATGEQIDLNGATMALGRAVTGHMELLGRQGVVLSEQTKKTGDFNLVLKDLDKAFGGAAAAAGQTFAGQMRILKVNIGETMEQIGGRLLPVLLPLVTKIGDVAKRVMDWIDAHQGLVKTLVPILAGVGGLLTVLGPVAIILPKIVGGVISLGKNLIWLATNPVALAIGAVGLLAVTIYKLREAEKDEGATLRQYGIDMRKQSADIMDIAAKKAGLTADAYQRLIDKYHGDKSALESSILCGRQEIVTKENLAKATKEYKAGLEKQTKAQGDGTAALKEFLEGLGKLPPAYKEISTTIAETPLIGNWGKARQDLIDVFQAWNDKAAVTFSFIGAISKSTVLKLVDDVQYAKKILKKFAEDPKAKLQETFAKIDDVVSKVVGSVTNLFGSMDQLISVNRDKDLKATEDKYKKQVTALDQVYKKTKAANEATTASKRAAIEAEAAAKAEQAEKDITNEQELAERLAIIEAEKQAKLSALDAEAKAIQIEQEDKLAKDKAKIEEDLAAEKERIQKAAGRAQKAIAIATAVMNIAEAVTKALTGAIPPFNFILAGITAAAGAVQLAAIKATSFGKGGYVDRPTLALIGERGPEVVLPVGRFGMAAAAAGAGGAINFKQYVYFSGDIRTAWDIDEISEKLAKKTQEAIQRGRR